MQSIDPARRVGKNKKPLSGTALNLFRLRKERGWSQQRLADEAGVTRHDVMRHEGGQTPRLGTLKKYARVLGVTVEQLIAGDDEDEEAALAARLLLVVRAIVARSQVTA